MPARQLTDAMVAKLPVKADRYTHADPQLPGHYIRVQPSGSKTFAVIMRDPRGKQVLHTIGDTRLHKIAEARDLARDAIKAIKNGSDRKGPESFESVSEEWFKRHVQAKGLRNAKETRRYLDKWILPALGGRDFVSIKRADIAKLLDAIEDKAGPVAADNALKRIGPICNWYQSRHDDYTSPVVKGMNRAGTKERSRERTLSDDEIRTLWKASGTYANLLKLSLLTAQRREKVAAMRWQDIDLDGVWTVPTEAREKGNIGEAKLPKMALDIIKLQPRFASNPYVFAGRTRGSHFSGYSKGKARLGVDWAPHDLRRTARSLMSRAGVNRDVSERVLGHAINGVEGTYDRHSYRQEKDQALKALSGVLTTILNLQANVVAMRKRR
jgi:integrase